MAFFFFLSAYLGWENIATRKTFSFCQNILKFSLNKNFKKACAQCPDKLHTFYLCMKYFLADYTNRTIWINFPFCALKYNQSHSLIAEKLSSLSCLKAFIFVNRETKQLNAEHLYHLRETERWRHLPFWGIWSPPFMKAFIQRGVSFSSGIVDPLALIFLPFLGICRYFIQKYLLAKKGIVCDAVRVSFRFLNYQKRFNDKAGFYTISFYCHI